MLNTIKVYQSQSSTNELNSMQLRYQQRDKHPQRSRAFTCHEYSICRGDGGCQVTNCHIQEPLGFHLARPSQHGSGCEVVLDTQWSCGFAW